MIIRANSAASPSYVWRNSKPDHAVDKGNFHSSSRGQRLRLGFTVQGRPPPLPISSLISCER